MRFALFVAAALAAAFAAGCKGDPFRPDAGDEVLVDAYKPPWFFPAPGEVKNWDIQLQAPYSLTTARAMMIVNLWDVVPAATTIMYDDATSVPVPAGSQANAIAGLKALGAKVICHVGTGAIRLGDPDATKFPGYEASPPNRPTAVAANSAIGWSTSIADATERFVDYRNPVAQALLVKRVKLAKEIGCDGILAYRNDLSAFIAPGLEHGFPTQVTSMHDTEWVVKVAKAGHDLMISVGGRGGQSAPNLGELDDDYDWLLAERCGEDSNCDAPREFIEAKRAVFGLDYTVGEDGTTPNTLAVICPKWVNGMIDGIIKPPALDETAPLVCP